MLHLPPYSHRYDLLAKLACLGAAIAGIAPVSHGLGWIRGLTGIELFIEAHHLDFLTATLANLLTVFVALYVAWRFLYRPAPRAGGKLAVPALRPRHPRVVGGQRGLVATVSVRQGRHVVSSPRNSGHARGHPAGLSVRAGRAHGANRTGRTRTASLPASAARGPVDGCVQAYVRHPKHRKISR